MRSFACSISVAGARSPSSQPSERATAALVVASARHPGSAASFFALATSHAFGRTRIGGSRWKRRNAAAFALESMRRGYSNALARAAFEQLDDAVTEGDRAERLRHELVDADRSGPLPGHHTIRRGQHDHVWPVLGKFLANRLHDLITVEHRHRRVDDQE